MRVLWTVTVGLPLASPAEAADAVRFVAMGDLPYRVPEDYARFEALIGAVNRQAPDFVLHVGDIKSGSSPCSDEAYRRIHAYFATIESPVVYTPGDNEWTDCYRSAAGGMDPLDRLAALRRLFFAAPRSLGGRPIPLVRQADVAGSPPAHEPLYVENARFAVGDVTIVVAHVVGSNNNRRHGHPAALAEHEARDRATASWIRAGFDAATAERSGAVVLAMHADLFAQGNGLPAPSNRSGFARTLAAIAVGAERFAGPVLVVHGDGHVYQVDRPFLDSAGRRLANVTRVEVFGYPTVAAVEITVVPGAAEPFHILPIEAPEPVPGADQR